jgi:hypothetical protein
MVMDEIVARSVKNDLRNQMREKMRELAIPCIEPFKEVAVQCFNIFIGNTGIVEFFL